MIITRVDAGNYGFVTFVGATGNMWLIVVPVCVLAAWYLLLNEINEIRGINGEEAREARVSDCFFVSLSVSRFSACNADESANANIYL